MSDKGNNIDLNEVIISGHVKNDIFYAVTENNIPVVNFILTGNGYRNDKEANRNINHRVVAYNEVANYIKNNVKTDDYLLIKGSLRYRKVPVNGKNFYSCDVEAKRVTIAPTNITFFSSRTPHERSSEYNKQEAVEDTTTNEVVLLETE